MERRAFIRLSAFTAAALTLPLLESCNGLSKEDAMSMPALLGRLVNDKEIKAIGQAYRKQTTAEDNTEELTVLLSHNKVKADAKELEAALEKQVAADFEIGKTIHVNGWVLSVTEARQCALYSILKA